MRTHSLLQHIAGLVQARNECQRRIDAGENTENMTHWWQEHTRRLHSLERNFLPSGSGFDNGTAIDLDRSTADRLEFVTSFHHMNEGRYTHWTSHTIIVKPAFVGISLRVTGRDSDGIKEDIAQVFQNALAMQITKNRDYFCRATTAEIEAAR